MNDQETRDWQDACVERDNVARTIARYVIEGRRPPREMLNRFAAYDASAQQYLVTR